MAVMTTAGSKISISSVLPATYNDAGYNALTWQDVGEVTDLGDGLGRTYNIVNHNPVATRLTQKLKGSYDPGTLTIQYGRDFSDQGQTQFKNASVSDNPYAFKITLQNGKKLCFTALVTTFSYTLSGVDTITAASSDLALMTDVIELVS